MSMNLGQPPAATIAETVGIAVFEVVITSSPGVSAAVDADAVARAAVRRQFLLERANALPEDQPSRAQDLIDRGQRIVAFGFIFRAIIPDWYRHRDAE
jgi:hypothetical protein